MKRSCLLISALVALISATASGQPPRLENTACVACHENPDLVGEEGAEMVRSFSGDVHAAVGLSCHHCHGGNPDASLAEDMDSSMDTSFRGGPFVGAPARGEVPRFCGKCHSDPAYMKRFKPDIRVDQESEYWTSQHGEALRLGDVKVATCIDCHGIHGILRAGNPRSPVYPSRVAETCRSCHADPERMSGYTLPGGRPLGIDQYARWRRSVHAAALLDREDLSAPTCNDCHGNHGATPPGLESIAFVCGQCHGREAELFRRSPKQAAWEVHNEYLQEAGAEGCPMCHDPSEPQGKLTSIHSFSECTICHGNHGIVRPTVALLSPLPATPCSLCHDGIGPLAEEIPESESVQRRYEEAAAALLAEAAEQGLEGDDRFDWLVDQALRLPAHTLVGETEGDAEPRLRPEFSQLFSKFRIGKTYYTYRDPVSGEEVRADLMRCTNCHSPEPVLTDTSQGLLTGQSFLRRMQELTALAARAERTLLSARRGGIETREAFLQVEHAVDAQIGLEVLVHTFSIEGAFGEKHQEGMQYARNALESGHLALQELSSRRLGLAVSLVFITLVLIGLAVKIRQVSRQSGDKGSNELEP